MGVAKVNGGSSYENQGDRNKEGKLASDGTNLSLGSKSKPAKQDAKAWKSKSRNDPPVPDWLA